MCTVLVISDDHLTKDRVGKILDGLQLHAIVAVTDFEVTRACVSARPGIVIADIETVGGVGFESIATARRLTRDAYIIALARNRQESHWPRVANACGADEYIAGDMSMSRLVAVIETCKHPAASLP